MLHISARHVCNAQDAIDCYFAGVTTYNAERQRFETQSTTHVLLWVWRIPGRQVSVISCFRREGE